MHIIAELYHLGLDEKLNGYILLVFYRIHLNFTPHMSSDSESKASRSATKSAQYLSSDLILIAIGVQYCNKTRC